MKYPTNMGYLKRKKKRKGKKKSNVCILAFPLSVQRCHLLVEIVITPPVDRTRPNSGRFFVLNRQKGEKMPRRTKYNSVFASQLSDSQSGVSQPEKMTARTGPLSQRRRDRPQSRQANAGLLKVKLPKFRKVEKKLDRSSRECTTEAVADARVCREAAANPHAGGRNTD